MTEETTDEKARKVAYQKGLDDAGLDANFVYANPTHVLMTRIQPRRPPR